MVTWEIIPLFLANYSLIQIQMRGTPPPKPPAMKISILRNLASSRETSTNPEAQ